MLLQKVPVVINTEKTLFLKKPPTLL